MLKFNQIQDFFNNTSNFFMNNIYGMIIYKILFSIFIFFIGKFISKILISMIKKTMQNIKANERTIKTLSSVCCSIVRYGIDFIIIYNILILFTDDKSLLTFLGVFGVAIGLGAQNFVKDIINGFLILLEDQFAVGDYISIDPRSGIVKNIGLRTTTIISPEGYIHIIPNSEIKIVTNQSKGYAKLLIDIGIPIAKDIDTVINILKDEMTIQKNIISDLIETPNVLGIFKMTVLSIELRIEAKCISGTKESVNFKLLASIKNRLSKENIL